MKYSKFSKNSIPRCIKCGSRNIRYLTSMKIVLS